MIGGQVKWNIKPSKKCFRITIVESEMHSSKKEVKSVTLEMVDPEIYSSWLAAVRCAVKSISMSHPTYALSVGCTRAFVKLKNSCEDNQKHSLDFVIDLHEISNFFRIIYKLKTSSRNLSSKKSLKKRF